VIPWLVTQKIQLVILESNKKNRLVIAIDGPAASGKSTTARLVAKRLGYLYIDTGAMYRALTLEILNQKIAVDDDQSIAAAARRIDIKLIPGDNGPRTFLDGKDVSEQIRMPEISKIISTIAANREVRQIMKAKQIELARKGDVVMDGRDIGTVVLPDADLKIFMQATLEDRTDRRVKELEKKGITADWNVTRNDILRRDEIDSTRDVAPLRPADDAVTLDNSQLTIEEQVQYVLDLVAKIKSERASLH
jgi:cytidylate kinase